MEVTTDEPVTPAGRLFLQPNFFQIINCAIGFKDPLDIEAIKLELSNSLMVKHPRFCSLLVVDKQGKEFWRRTQINIDDHIIIHHKNPDLNSEFDEDDDQKINSFLADFAVSSPLSKDKPLWEIHLVIESKCAILRIHHSLGDGISLMSLFLASCKKLDDNGDGGNNNNNNVGEKNRGKGGKLRIMGGIKLIWWTIIAVIKFIGRSLWVKDVKTAIIGGDGVELWPRMAATAKLSLEDMKTVKRAIPNATINDVLFGVVSSGFSKYLDIRSSHEKLNGPSNYKAWKCDMELTLATKRKLGFVSGLVKRDKEDATKQDQWDTCNSMIVAWMTGSMAPHVKETVRYMRNAKEIWEQLAKRYDIVNGTRKYKLNKSLYDLRQKGMTVTEYYSRMKCLWDELDAMRRCPPITQMNPEINAFIDAMNAEKEEDKLFQFLNGLDDEYSAERSHMLMFKKLPSLEEAYSRLVQEEAQRELSREKKEEVESSAMYGKKEDGNTNTRRDEWCSVCEMKGHSKEKCWRIIGYPEWHPKAKGNFRGDRHRRGENSSGGGRFGQKKPFQHGRQTGRMAGNARTDEDVNISGEQAEKMIRGSACKHGSDTEEELETGFAGLSIRDY